MKRFISIALVSLMAFTCLSFAAPDPSGRCDDMYYDQTDDFGWIARTIPSANPGPSNAWVDMTYDSGELIQFKNIASPIGVQMVHINPETGAQIGAAVPLALPTPGYIMGGTCDGSYLYVCQWYPTGGIHKMTLAGGYVSTITPSVPLSGSPRCIVWSGSYLFVGTNVASGNTNLYKMTTSGTIPPGGSWSTGAVVGWYMGGDWSSNAPTGGQLCVVDNVGNKIKRLAFSGGDIIIADEVNSPAIAPDVAEGLAFDGSLLVHNGAYASQLKVWFLCDGSLQINTAYISGPPILTYSMNVHNYSATTRTFQIWSRIRSVSGSVNVLVMGPITRTLPGLANPTRTLTQLIPGTVPLGDYYYISYLGTYPSIICDSSYFEFSVPTNGDGGTWISESRSYGDCFDEYAIETTPNAFALEKAYPNPFNPTTNISYSLATAGNVKLTIFDATGREVANLVNGFRDAGSHQVTFDASKLASGVYLYQLNSTGQVATGKMVLMK